MKEIVKTVADYYGLWEDTLYRRTRKRKITKARQIAIYAIRIKLNTPYKKIGDFFKRDHSSAVHSVKTVENDMQTDKEFKKEVDEIISIVSGINMDLKKRICNPTKF